MITLNTAIKMLLDEIWMRIRDEKQHSADMKLATTAVNSATKETAYWKARCAAAEDKLIDILLFGES